MHINRSSSKPKALLFVHDGIGLGHLSRICKIANGLSDLFSCVVVTGQKQAAWMLNDYCDFVKLPNLDKIVRKRSEFLGTPRYLDYDDVQAFAFRQPLIEAVVRTFDPDVIIVDHIPAGRRGEILSAIAASSALKYLTLRPVLGAPSESRELMFANGGEEALRSLFKRILIASDERVSMIDQELAADSWLIEKCLCVGYVSEIVSYSDVMSMRRVRGINDFTKWVVCSSGSGFRNEQMYDLVRNISLKYSSVVFDVVIGPRGDQAWVSKFNSLENVRVSKFECDLARSHSSADLVLTAGGYNSVAEAMGGGSEIIVFNPFSTMDMERDERTRHAELLSRIYPVRLCHSSEEVFCAVAASVSNHGRNRMAAISNVNLGGVARIKEILLEDLKAVRASAPL